MPTSVIATLILGAIALILHALAESAFEVVFGYIGASAVWLLSFRRIRMDPLHGGESVLASWLGVVFTVLVAFGICYLIQRL